jgi:dipeptidase
LWSRHDRSLYATNLIELATERGYYDPTAGQPFNFRDVFDPATVQKKRYTATRVWSLFRRLSPSQQFSPDFHRGEPGLPDYPLWIEPDRKLSLRDIMNLMRDHYEGTDFDMTQGVDAGPFGNPNRWRPMAWKQDGAEYTWERPISTQQTGFSMIAQCRAQLPDPLGGVLWYGVDDTYTTCWFPLYCCADAVPASFATGRLGEFSWDSAWWVFNIVANYACLKYGYMVRDIQAVQAELEEEFLTLQPAVEKAALELYEQDPDLARQYLTSYSVGAGEKVTRRWRELAFHLFTKYNDGYVRDEKGHAQEVGYSEAWRGTVLQLRPDQFRLQQAPEDSLTNVLPY